MPDNLLQQYSRN